MNGFFNMPEVQGGLLPFVISLLVTLLFLGIGRYSAGKFAGLAPVAALIVAVIVLEGIADFPPPGSKQKLFYLFVLAAVVGVAVEALRFQTVKALGLAGAVILISLIWLSWRQLGSADLELIITLLLLFLGALMVFALSLSGSVQISEGFNALKTPAVLMVASFAAGVVSLLGASIGIAQLFIAIGAALGGLLLVAYTHYVRTGQALPRFGLTGQIGIGGTWLACFFVMILFSDSVNRWALCLILLCFPMASVAYKLTPAPTGKIGRVAAPFVYGAIMSIPAIAAVIWVILTAEPSGY